MMKMYEMIIDDGVDIHKICRLGKSQKDIMARFSGNGEFLRVREVTEDFSINVYSIMAALKDGGFGVTECELVRDCLTACYSNCVEG